MTVCQRNIKTRSHFKEHVYDSLALLLKLSFLSSTSVPKVFLLFLNDMVDREKPQLTVEQLASVLNLFLDVLRDELQ